MRFALKKIGIAGWALLLEIIAILRHPLDSGVKHFHARARATGRRGGREKRLNFSGILYGPKIFTCKTAQFCATRRESEMAEIPGVRNGVQAGENERKNSFLNEKSVITILL